MATPKIDAYFEEVRRQNVTAEDKARHIGETPELLKELLLDTLTCYTKHVRDIFKGAVFHFASKRLLAKDEEHALIWELRLEPDKPESYENQQTSLGRVSLVRYMATYSRHR